MEYGDDDLPQGEVRPLISKEQWYVFRVTWPSQMFWLLVYGLIALIGYAIVGVRLSHAAPVCHQVSDAYELALADTQGTGQQLWETKVRNGDCADLIEAKYYRTLSTYTSDEFSRVVEYRLWGKSLYGLITTLPRGVWMVQHQPHQGHPEDMAMHEKFYSTWNMPNYGRPRLSSCCNKNDCYATPIRQVDGKYYARRREDGMWLLIPPNKLEQLQPDERESPDGQSHACIAPPYAGNAVYCATLGTGT